MWRRHHRNRIAAGLALTALQLCSPSSAVAQQGWDIAPATLSTAAVPLFIGNQDPAVTMSAGGNIVAVWTEVPAVTTYRIVRAARFDGARGAWDTATTLFSSATQAAQDVRLAGDAAGNAIAVWTAVTVGSPTEFARAARFSASTGTWSDIPLPVTNHSATPVVAMNAVGDAVIAWRELVGVDAGVHAVRYAQATTMWSGDERPAGTGADPALLDAAMDDAGNIHLVWRASAGIRSSRYSVANSAWGSVADLGTYSDIYVVAPRVAMNGAGDAIVTWETGGGVTAVLRSRTDNAWSAPAQISSGTWLDEMARPAIDAAGAAIVVWRRLGPAGPSGGTGVQARRYAPGTGWSSIVDLVTGASQPTPSVAVAVDPSGNAFVTMNRFVTAADARLHAARFSAATGVWSAATPLSAPAQLSALSNVAVDSNGNAVAIWFQAVGVHVTQAARWTATPAAPTLLGAAPSVQSVSVSVGVGATTDPAFAPSNLEFSIDGGVSWTARSPAGIDSPFVVAGLTDGVAYELRVRAVNSAGAGAGSVVARVRSGTSVEPGALRVVARQGNLLTLAWTPPSAGLEPSSYQLEGGIAGQSQVLAVLPTGGAATQFSVSVPDGTFFVRMASLWGTTRLAVSSPITVAMNAPAAPDAPTALLASANGSALALSWRNRWEHAAPTGIRLAVSGAVSTTLDLPVSESFTYSGVPPGTYTFTVSALNGSTAGAPSAPTTVSFPGTCTGAPAPPAAFSATAQGGTVYLDWLPAASGEAATGYVLLVSGAFTGSLPSVARTLAVPAPPGSYTIRVVSVGPCGTSQPTPPQTVIVR